MKALERRLSKVEVATAPARRHVIIICELDETPEQAKARHYAEHPDDEGAEFLLVEWC